MKRLLETIKIQDGIIQNIIYHNQRFNRTRRHFWENSISIDLYEYIIIPEEFKSGTVRCRVLYEAEIEEVQFINYVKKPINSLKLVETDLEYSFKWENRNEINKLVEQNKDFDDILMVKNGLITDTSYANIVFKKEDIFFTPKSPLLPGTKRQKFIDELSIIEIDIKPSNLNQYSHFAVINAFNDLEESNLISINNISN
jgi:4-amino-4-deoxychorismate lyase